MALFSSHSHSAETHDFYDILCDASLLRFKTKTVCVNTKGYFEYCTSNIIVWYICLYSRNLATWEHPLIPQLPVWNQGVLSHPSSQMQTTEANSTQLEEQSATLMLKSYVWAWDHFTFWESSVATLFLLFTSLPAGTREEQQLALQTVLINNDSIHQEPLFVLPAVTAWMYFHLMSVCFVSVITVKCGPGDAYCSGNKPQRRFWPLSQVFVCLWTDFVNVK